VVPDVAKKPKQKSASQAGRKSGPGKASGSSRAAKPKKRSAGKTPAPKDKCFVISPFGGWHDDYYTEIFCPAIKSAGLSPARADDLFRSSNIVHDIWHLVLSSRVLLADLTNKNPNVFYELGLAHAARKPVLLLTQSMEDVPFDLRALRVIEYEVEHPKWGEVLRDGIRQGLSEMLDSPQSSVLPTFLLEEPSEEPTVSKEEARLLGLQQQIESLRSEVRDSRPSSRGAPLVEEEEALALVESYLEKGVPRSAIVRRLTELGAPRHWIERTIRGKR
jgi:hypothetical protein